MKARRPALLATLSVLVLAACGGGGDDPSDSTASPAGGDGGTPVVTMTATGSSSRTAALHWTGATDLPVVVERQAGAADWQTLAALAAGSDEYQDQGLAPLTTYRYRVRTADGRVLASAQTQTDDADPVVTPVPARGDELAQGVLGAGGGRLELADGSFVLEADAGTFSQDTEVRIARVANSAPDGVEDGLRVELAAVPAKALKLTLRYGAALADDAAGLAIAVQQADGSWLAMPTSSHADDRSLRATLKPTATPGRTPARAGRPSAHDLTWVPQLEFDAVKFRDLYLSPRSATVRIGASQRLVPYAHTLILEECADGGLPEDNLLCVPLTVRQSREVPLLNQKDGYERQWMVEGAIGGSAALGLVVPHGGEAGATYTAPARAPQPNPVTVTFRSRHLKSGRTANLKARVLVEEPHWTGVVRSVMPGAADVGFGTQARGTWTLTADSTTEQYQVAGEQTLTIENIHCTVSASPASTALPPGLLKIDRSTQPATYVLDFGSLWNTTISGVCPGNPGGSSVPMTVPGQLQVSGPLSADGQLIQGSTVIGGIRWDWSFAVDR